jgi:four helix bundle protein
LKVEGYVKLKKMAKIERFEDLEIWIIAREVCNDIWNIIENTPLQKDYKLKEQINGSSGSIMNNISEGFERDGNRAFYQFLSVSKASCAETRSQLHRCLDRKYIDDETFKALIEKTLLINKKISSFMTYLKNSDRKGSKYD